MLEEPEEMAKPRYCFAAGRKLTGTECCAAQKLFPEAEPPARSAPPFAFGAATTR